VVVSNNIYLDLALFLDYFTYFYSFSELWMKSSERDEV